VKNAYYIEPDTEPCDEKTMMPDDVVVIQYCATAVRRITLIVFLYTFLRLLKLFWYS